MLRKLFTFVICLVATIASASAQTPPDNEIWYTTTDGKKLDIELENDWYTIISHHYADGKWVIRTDETIYVMFEGRDGSTGLYFEGSKNLETVMLPCAIEVVYWPAFCDCINLKSVTIPDSVTKIDSSAFGGCSSLEALKGNHVSEDGRCVVIDGELKAFIPTGLTEYTIPDSVYSIGDYAFYGCGDLTSITIHEDVTKIEESAFCDCSNLKHLTIACEAEVIPESLLAQIESVTLLNVELYDYCAAKQNIKTISFGGEYATPDGRCYIADGKLERFFSRDLTEYAFSEYIIEFSAKALEECKKLKCAKVANMQCYDGLKNIVSDVRFAGPNASEDGRCYIVDGELVVFSAKGLTEYTMPNNVTKIGAGVLINCDSLKRLTITNSATTFEPDTFNGCRNLTALNINCNILKDYWPNCQLTDLTIGKDVTYIDQEFLKRCTGRLTLNCKHLENDMVVESRHTEIVIGESVETIAHGTFAELSNLRTFKGKYASEDGRCLISGNCLLAIAPAELTEFNIPEGVTSIGGFTFSGCQNLTNITIPDSVTEIGWRAFQSCTGLTTITIPHGVKELGNVAFGGCTNLAEVNIPDGVTTIGVFLFENCKSLTSITFPASVTTIEKDVFIWCSALTSVYCLALEPPTFEEMELSEEVIIYVPKEAVKAYKDDANWQQFKKQIKKIK